MRRLPIRVVGGIAVAATAVAGTAVAFAWPDASPAPQAAEMAAAQVLPAAPVLPAAKAAVNTVDLGAKPGAPKQRRVDLPARDTKPFSTVGITWTDPAAVLHGTAQVRARAAGGKTWSRWVSLPIESERGPDAPSEAVVGRIRGATAPQWVGPSDGVQVRVVATSGKVSDALPAGLRLELVDPGTPPGGAGGGSAGQGGGMAVGTVTEPEVGASSGSPGPDPSGVETSPSASASTSPDPSLSVPAPPDGGSTTPSPPPSSPPPSSPPPSSPPPPSSTTPAPRPTSLVMPPVVTRSAWRADETLNRAAPSYGTAINAVFVHHTDDANTYSCADSAALVRGIHAYHVRSRGWSDIGYNFLVDKCGTLFEGRKGGIERPVIGAHTAGFNTNNMGVVIIGRYITTNAPAAALSVVAQLAAYRLGKYGNDPSSKVNLVAGVAGKFRLGTMVTMNRISGHRDGDATECPGDALYAQLPIIREQASGWVTGLALKPPTGGIAWGGVYYTRGVVTLSWSVATPSAQLSRFEILVDGRITTTLAADVRSTPLLLAAGRHTVSVRALHADGSWAVTDAPTIVSDATAPTFPRRPELSLRGGTVSTSSVPVTLAWRATDNTVLRSVSVTAPLRRDFASNATVWATAARPGSATSWQLLATDVVGNTARAAVSRMPVLLAETSARKSGKWTTRRNGAYLGGRAMVSSSKNAALTWTFTGSSVALIASRASAAGKATIYIDGRNVGTVNLKGKTANRQAVWTRTWAGSGKHTVKIVAGAARPGVTTDGLVYLR